MISVKTFFEKISYREIVASLVDVMATNFEDFIADQARFNKAITLLAKELGWMYEPIIQRVREKAEREGNTEILQLSEEEHTDLIRRILQDYHIIQEEKKLEAKKIRCERLCEGVKTVIDGFYDTELNRRAIDFVLNFCEKCLVTFAVEFDMPLYFYIELLGIDESKIVIDSLINSVVAEFDSEAILEFSLNEKFMDELFDEILSRTYTLRQSGNLKTIDRYKDKEYTVDIML